MEDYKKQIKKEKIKQRIYLTLITIGIPITTALIFFLLAMPATEILY